MAVRILNRLYRRDDPRRYLHVPRRHRQNTDDGPASTAVDDTSGADDDIDHDEVRRRGGIVDEADL